MHPSTSPLMLILAGLAPVAMMKYLLESTSSFIAIVFLSINDDAPLYIVTLFPFKRVSTPLDNFLTVLFLKDINLEKLILNVASIPNSKDFLYDPTMFAAWHKTFVGIHPLFKHVPPKSLFSTIAVLRPN